ncbi:hypothetical protein ACIGHM_29040 [Streptomyces diastaticus]|uniref:hypothetical protein n=1 Tax=Streptomyces diastaticus TaxID=1956 RepID=UPI0037D25362
MKHLFTFLFAIVSVSIYSQVVVTDVTANQTLATQLTTSTNQLSQLERNYELLKESEEKYQKINSIVTSVYNLGEILKLQKEAIFNVKLFLEKTNLKGDAREKMVVKCKNIVESIGRSSENISNVLKEGFFSMTDKERIDFFKEERHHIYFLVSKTRGYALPYLVE